MQDINVVLLKCYVVWHLFRRQGSAVIPSEAFNIRSRIDGAIVIDIISK